VTVARPPLHERFLRAGVVPRLVAILVGVPCLYVITERGGVFFLLLVDLIILLGLTEFFHFMEAKGFRPSRLLGYAAAIAVSVHVYWGGPALTLIVTVILLLIMVREVFRPHVDEALTNIAVTVLGVMYVGWLGSHFIMLRELPADQGATAHAGAELVFFAALVIWACDTAAYVVGILIGGRKLVPHISPAKTWAGAIGGVVGGTLAGWVCAVTFLDFVTPATGAGLGLASAVLGQFGDLVESLLKRDAGLKDSAQLIPGHGGILDRVDSLLFSAPMLYYWFRFVVL
jgi:phosphatidate cytidylyltransferase